MAKYTTQSGRTFDDKRGWGNFINIKQKGGYTASENGLYIPAHSMNSLSDSEINKALDYYQQYVKDGGNVNDAAFRNKLLNIMGGDVNAENKLAFIDYVVDTNAEKLGFDSTGNTSSFVYDEDTKTYQKVSGAGSQFNSGLADYVTAIDQSLMTDARSRMANQYRTDMYGAINNYEQATNATLAAAEVDAYRMLGQQQLELENQIAAQRQQALKSGVTSAQLASQELASMFAAQSSAQSIAQDVLSRRADQAATFGQQRMAVETGLYDIINNNQTTRANALTQLGAAQASYNSYIQQAMAQYGAADYYYNKNPDAYRQYVYNEK